MATKTATFSLRTVLQTLTESLGAGFVSPDVYRVAIARAKKLNRNFTEKEFLDLVSEAKATLRQ